MKSALTYNTHTIPDQSLYVRHTVALRLYKGTFAQQLCLQSYHLDPAPPGVGTMSFGLYLPKFNPSQSPKAAF